MDDVTRTQIAHDEIAPPRARVGMIIPSVNRMSEPQFNHYAPPGLASMWRAAGSWVR